MIQILACVLGERGSKVTIKHCFPLTRRSLGEEFTTFSTVLHLFRSQIKTNDKNEQVQKFPDL